MLTLATSIATIRNELRVVVRAAKVHIAIASQLGDGFRFALTLRGHDDTGEILIRATCLVFIRIRAIIATGLVARRLLHLMPMQKLVLLALVI